jgi:GntR family transcriptional regulator
VKLSNIRTNSSQPLYMQIKTSIVSAIDAQDMLPGDKIPSLEDLCKLYGVSRMTARQAVQELVHEGRLYTVIGKGTFVSPVTKIEPPMNTIWGFSDSFSSIYGDHLSRLLSIKIHTADNEIAEKLGISTGSQIYRLSRLRLLNQKPLAVEHTHLPAERFPLLESYDWNTASLYAVLRDHYHIQMSQGKQHVEACSAPLEIAQLLNIQPEAPILVMDRTIATRAGWMAEYAHTFYRSDCIRLSITMAADEPLTLVKTASP